MRFSRSPGLTNDVTTLILKPMYGAKAALLGLMFVICAGFVLSGITQLWKLKDKAGASLLWRLGITAFFLLWFSLMCSHYYRKAQFLQELRSLSAAEVGAVRIGRHEFKDPETIRRIVGALGGSKWFEVNHGGWGDSIQLTLEKRSGAKITLDVAQYFREPAAIVGPSNPKGLSYSPTEAISFDLPKILQNIGVILPNCDTPHGRPCTPEQSNP